MEYTLPDLPYALDALEPVISREALKLHHGAHHRAYVDKLNAALAGQQWQAPDSVEALVAKLKDVPDALREPVRRFGGGHANHCLLWQTLSPEPGEPSRRLAALIDRQFGGLDGLRTAFSEAGGTVFGSGWVFLSHNAVSGELVVFGLPNQDTPLSHGLQPLLACDLWEHAYYLDYRNRRDHWLRDWWRLVDWEQAEKRLGA